MNLLKTVLYFPQFNLLLSLVHTYKYVLWLYFHSYPTQSTVQCDLQRTRISWTRISSQFLIEISSSVINSQTWQLHSNSRNLWPIQVHSDLQSFGIYQQRRLTNWILDVTISTSNYKRSEPSRKYLLLITVAHGPQQKNTKRCSRQMVWIKLIIDVCC